MSKLVIGVLIVILLLSFLIYYYTKSSTSPTLTMSSGSSGINIDPAIWRSCIQQDDEGNFDGQTLDQIKFVCDPSNSDNKRHYCDSDFFPDQACAKVCNAVNSSFKC